MWLSQLRFRRMVKVVYEAMMRGEDYRSRLMPFRPRQRIQRDKCCCVRAIFLPCVARGITRKVASASPVMFAHDANPLHILDRLRLDPGDLIAVEV